MRVAGSGGFAVNIMADNATLNVQGTQFIKVYQVRRENDELSPTKRHFCSECASNLWFVLPQYPNNVYPFAASIDTPLPTPPKKTHLMWRSRASWVDDVEPSETCALFDQFPDQDIEKWHRANNLYVE
jgi:hypothetical protein